MKLKQSAYFTIILLLISILQVSHAQINVKHVANGLDVSTKQGFFYTLPYTLIQVDIEVLKTEYIAGPYAEYASKYLDLQDVGTDNDEEYLITGVALSSFSVPDPEQVYFVEMTDKLTKEERSLMISLSDAGLITDLQGNLPKGLQNSFSRMMYDYDPSTKDIFRYFAETNLVEQIDTIVRMVVVDTATIEKSYLDRRWVEKSTEQKAIDAANKIERIREARLNLLTGYQEIPYPAGTIAYMDKELQKTEQEYLSLFTGIAVRKTFKYTFYVDPVIENEESRVPVCVFSESSGIKKTGSAGGEQLFLKIENTGTFTALKQVVDSKNQSAGAEKGFFYRIPQTVKVGFDAGNGLISENLLPIGQLGLVTFLPPTVTSVQFHKNTGTVKTLLVE